MQRSDDDGFTWKRVGDPIVGQGRLTGQSTFTNLHGNLVADPFSHNVYAIYAAGETGVLKARTFTPNNIVVSRSTDLGETWTPSVAFSAPAGTSLVNIFPALSVDPVNGNLHAVWSDGRNVALTSSTDQGDQWTPSVTVNSAPASTAVFPWVAAYNGTVDVVYYGTIASSNLDSGASWHVYFAQQSGGGFTQTQVSGVNHVGVICTTGDTCAPGTRNLLDLFQVAIDPQNGKAAIIYTDDTLTSTMNVPNPACVPGQTTCPLPQAVLAQES